MAEPSVIYEDGEVVWVKWSSCWWPGEVWNKSRVPNDLISSIRKPVIAYVKFFQEESFECVKNHNNISKYNCEKKLEFIKKGMDKYRTNIKVMVNFPSDVVKAETLTKGNVNILQNLETPTKQKPAPAVSKPSSTPVASPVVVSKKAIGSYNSSTKVQITSSPAPKSDKKHTCPLCDFATDRMNLLMFHIKNHSSTTPRVNEPLHAVAKKTPTAKCPAKRSIEPDSIADDVRKIKESLKKAAKPAATPRKSRDPPAPKTAPAGRSRASKKEEKEEVPVTHEKVEEKPKPANELKKKLLADWSDEEDEVVPETKEKIEEPPKSSPTKPAPIATPSEKAGESSRIRNIPKKQRVNEIYVKPEAQKEDLKVEAPKSPVKESPKKVEEPFNDSIAPEMPKKSPKANKRKLEMTAEPQSKMSTETDDLLMATADLLNETEVPKVQPPSTFHKTNDIDKRNLPPKERNKRIFRDNQSRESPNDHSAVTDNFGSIIKLDEKMTVTSPIQNELMLPHKKKQSSRFVTIDKPFPMRETRNIREPRQETPALEPRTRKKRKSTEPAKPDESTIDSKAKDKAEPVQSPLREAEDVNTDSSSALSPSNSNSTQRRGQKRRISEDIQEKIVAPYHDGDSDAPSEPKKLHKSDSETPKSIVACSSETICITSKGQLSVACKDTLVTTESNSAVMVTSQVIITEAIQQPIVCSAPAQSPKPHISTSIKIPTQALKDALIFPPEELMEMKKQGLVTVGSDKKQKLTEKGRLIYKQIREKTAGSEKKDVIALEDQNKVPETTPIEAPPQKVADVADVGSQEPLEEKKSIPEALNEPVDDIEMEVEPVKESNGTSAPETTEEEHTNNNDIDKESETNASSKDSQEDSIAQDPVENGKEADNDSEAPADDTNNGLIALQAESFGGPPNCFYLCRQIGDRYEPVDNQILVLNAHNALVPYEGVDISTEESMVSSETSGDNLTGYPQLSPNSNIIINTPNGQKIELNHMAIMALQEQADENGIASIELSGEQLELNINGILEAISAQQEANENEALNPGAVLIDGDNALILDNSADLPVEINHSATQVSETLSKPIMSTTIAPEISSSKIAISDSVSKNLNIEDSLASIGVTQPSRSNILKSLELPITITNPTIVETVNHRKLANVPILDDLPGVAVGIGTFVIPTTDNGLQD